MNAYELQRIRESDRAIANIAVEAKKAHKSYGQLQAERYEKQLKEEQLAEKFKDEQPTPEAITKKRRGGGGGRPKKEKPVGWEDIGWMVIKGKMGKHKAAAMLHISAKTLTKWIDELVSGSESC